MLIQQQITMGIPAVLDGVIQPHGNRAGVTVYHTTEGSALLRHGDSKDHRPDLSQVKMMLGALDPLGLPLATLVVSGNAADDGLYVSMIQRARAEVLDHRRIMGERHLGRVLTAHATYYNHRRLHQGRHQRCPLPAASALPDGVVERHDTLGGLIHDYERRAA